MLTLNFNGTRLKVREDESSYRYRALMEKPQLVLKFSMPEYVEIPVGAWCEFQGERYTLNTPANIKKNGTRDIEYTLTLGTAQDNLGMYKMRDPVDRRLKWSLTGKPSDFLNAIVKNLNDRDGSVWTAGGCIDAAEKTVEFNHAYIDAALQDIANAFETEWEINDHTVSLGKAEYFKDDPLPLSYGKGNGFVPGVGRTTTDDELPVKRLYVQGGERNIDPSKYGSKELLLPKGQTLEYEGRTYKADADGYYIERTDKASDAVREDSLDCSEIYPSRVGEVTEVVTEEGKDSDGNPFTFHDFIDSTIPDNLNFNDCRIGGETATVVFQTGMLAGKEFDIEQTEDALTGYDHKTRKFKLVPQEIDGVMMPGGTYIPAVGDKYAVFGINLPQAYICDNEKQTGASWDMFKEAARKMYECEDQKFTFTGTLQGLWAKKNWLKVGGRLKVGGYILFSDEQFAPEGVKIRITGIKDYISSPYTPQLEISNSVAGKSLSSKLREIEQNEVKTESGLADARSFTKRRWRDAKETIGMLQDAWQTNFSHFSGSVNPLTVETMMMLVGDESLQFRFVKSKTDFTPVDDNISYDSKKKILTAPHGFIRHMTLGISDISSNHADSEYKVWEVNEYVSPTLAEAEKKFYLYAKVSSGDTHAVGEFILSETPVGMKEVSGFYHLLVGVLNSEYDGERSFVTLYGFTEILPGRITTDRIVSGDGTSWFDMVKASFKLGSKLEYNTVASGKGNLLLRGGFIQTGSGDITELGAWCGEWDEGRIYQLGDEVWWTAPDGTTSSYRYINRALSRGHRPDDSNYWQGYAEGVKGDTGEPGKDGQNGDYTSYVFKQSESKPATPTGTDKIPAGWKDSPTGEGRWWMSMAVISGQTDKAISAWSDPVQVTGEDGADGAYTDFKFAVNGSKTAAPAITRTSRNPGAAWHDDPPAMGDGQYQWMTKAKITADNTLDGQWSVPVCISGEDGKNGQNGKDGNGIASVTVTYAVGSNGTDVPLGEWSAAIPATLPGQYLWTRTVTTYTDGKSTTSYSVSRQGSDGKNGENGKAGPSVVFRGNYDPTETYYGNDRRVDVVYYEDRYYIAAQTAGTFSDKIPTNTQYWLEFGASFDSIATGLMFAEEAVIEKGVIRVLQTAEESEARIEARDNRLVMYNGANAQRLEVSGEPVGDVKAPIRYTVPQGGISKTIEVSSSKIPGVQHGRDMTETIDFKPLTFIVEADGTSVTVPSFNLQGSAKWGYVNIAGDFSFNRYTLGVYKEGVLQGNAVDSGEISMGMDNDFTLTTKPKTLTLNKGEYTLRLEVKWWIQYDIADPTIQDIHIDLRADATDYLTLVSDSNMIMKIGSDGILMSLGASFYAKFAMSGTDPQILLSGNGKGLRITKAGVQINRTGVESGWTNL